MWRNLLQVVSLVKISQIVALENSKVVNTEVVELHQHEGHLLNELFVQKGYNNQIRPARRGNDTLLVKLELSID